MCTTTHLMGGGGDFPGQFCKWQVHLFTFPPPEYQRLQTTNQSFRLELEIFIVYQWVLATLRAVRCAVPSFQVNLLCGAARPTLPIATLRLGFFHPLVKRFININVTSGQDQTYAPIGCIVEILNQRAIQAVWNLYMAGKSYFEGNKQCQSENYA